MAIINCTVFSGKVKLKICKIISYSLIVLLTFASMSFSFDSEPKVSQTKDYDRKKLLEYITEEEKEVNDYSETSLIRCGHIK